MKVLYVCFFEYIPHSTETSTSVAAERHSFFVEIVSYPFVSHVLENTLTYFGAATGGPTVGDKVGPCNVGDAVGTNRDP